MVCNLPTCFSVSSPQERRGWGRKSTPALQRCGKDPPGTRRGAAGFAAGSVGRRVETRIRRGPVRADAVTDRCLSGATFEQGLRLLRTRQYVDACRPLERRSRRSLRAACLKWHEDRLRGRGPVCPTISTDSALTFPEGLCEQIAAHARAAVRMNWLAAEVVACV